MLLPAPSFQMGLVRDKKSGWEARENINRAEKNSERIVGSLLQEGKYSASFPGCSSFPAECPV